MKSLILLFTIFILSACQSMHSSDPNSLYFTIPAGSTLSLNKKMPVPVGYTHAVIQAGTIIDDDEINDYEVNCRLDFKKFGPRIIEPEKFIVMRTEDGSQWISQPSILRFYTDIYLSSNKGTDILKMECQQYGDAKDRNFTVSEMQMTLGEIVTFIYANKTLD